MTWPYLPWGSHWNSQLIFNVVFSWLLPGYNVIMILRHLADTSPTSVQPHCMSVNNTNPRSTWHIGSSSSPRSSLDVSLSHGDVAMSTVMTARTTTSRSISRHFTVKRQMCWTSKYRSMFITSTAVWHVQQGNWKGPDLDVFLSCMITIQYSTLQQGV